MSSAFRIISRLDVKGPNLVKGIQLEGLRVLGKPEKFAKYFYDQGIDEIFLQDTVASLYGRNNLSDIISMTAKEIFIPLTVGGGIRNIDDIYAILRAGADKVSINTAAIENPRFIKESVKIFGSSTIVLSIEAVNHDGKYLAYTNNGRDCSNLEVIDWAKKAEDLGVGEIILTMVDDEGTGRGLNINFLEQVDKSISIPLVAHGGIGKINDIKDLLKKVNISGVAIASLFHYSFLNDDYVVDYHNEEGNIDFIKKKKIPKNFEITSIKNLKSELLEDGIDCRII